jgi:LacI family transcriptional regulator
MPDLSAGRRPCGIGRAGDSGWVRPNDRTALGAYDAIKELGLRIPQGASVIGYDDQQEIVAYMRPPLTTMRLPCYEMGAFAVAAILDGRSPGRQMLRCEPVLRGSLAAVGS